MDQMPPPPPKLRTIREEVWIAQSDLFLDTDVRLNYPFTARVAAASPFSLEELEAIFRDEVAPVVEYNLLDIAGEWAGFNDDWLVPAIHDRLARNPPVPYQLETWALDYWHRVAHLVRVLRALPPEIRNTRVQLWHKLHPVFLDENPPPPTDLPDWRHVDYVIREEMTPAYGPPGEALPRWLAACREP